MSSREIAWLKPVRKAVEDFPSEVRQDIFAALTIAANGGVAGTAKPFKGVGGGVFEIALKHRGGAFRAVYAVRIGDVLWVVDAFQKKSTSGIKTPQVDVQRIRRRIQQLREAYE